MEQELVQLHEDFKLHLQSDATNFAEIKDSLNKIDKKLDPLTQAYEGVMFSKKFIVGLASVVIAIAAVGGGVIWLVMTIVNSHR